MKQSKDGKAAGKNKERFAWTKDFLTGHSATSLRQKRRMDLSK
jgi:hypothetical protein